MARTRPIPAEQPLDAAWKAAGHVVTLAGAEAVAVQAVAVQAAASLTRAALLWPPIPAARAMVGLASALGPWLPVRPLPEQPVVVVMAGSGGAGRAATVPGGPPGAVRAAGAITLGVEEEFVLLDPSTGATVLAGPDLVRMLGGEPGVQEELMRFQVETGTGVCTGLDDLGRELVRLRRLAAAAAAHLGCRLVASGVAPYRTPGLAALTCQPRYYELARRYGPVVAEAGTCACHVHVGVPSRELGVQVLARLRPWLAPLLAVTANSPIAGGHDTGWASWRYTIQSRWPTAVPPAVWPDAVAYDTAVRGLIGQGAALDERSVYFLARLSPRYPTVEVRVADVCLDAGTAVLLAGLIRALVATALAEARRGTPVAAAPAAAGRWGPGRCGAAGARRGRSRPGHRAGRRCAGAPFPPPRSCPSRAQRPRRHRDDHQAAAPARGPGDRSRPPASPVHQRRIHARVHHRTRPRDAVRLRAGPLAPTRCPGPGSGARARTSQAMTHTGGESAASGFREQRSGQLRAARVLTGLLQRGDREGLPVLAWTISHHGAQVTGRSYAQPGSARRAALTAWAAALEITLGEEYHQDSRMTTITGMAERERTRHGSATITLTGDIWED